MVESMKNHKENTQKIKVMIDGSEKKRWTSWDMGKEHFEKWPGKKWDMYLQPLMYHLLLDVIVKTSRN